MIPIDSYVVKKSIEHYGKDLQSTVCMEECAELIQAISKEKRGSSDKGHLAEEMADVIICIEMLKQIYNITEDEIYSWIITKQERTIERIKKDVQSTETNAERIRNMTDDVCEWNQIKGGVGLKTYKISCFGKTLEMPVSTARGLKYCPYCGKKIKVVE